MEADALFLDVPNPWAAIAHTKRAIKKCNFDLMKMVEFAVSHPVLNKSKELLMN